MEESMFIPQQYFVFIVLFAAHYILTSFFPSIHWLCLFGGMINILINLPPPKLRVVLKGTNQSVYDPDWSVQFNNLYHGFKYGLIGYLITIAIVPYYLYVCANPGKDLESFMTACMETMVRLKRKMIANEGD
jgi:hypothetical protein